MPAFILFLTVGMPQPAIAQEVGSSDHHDLRVEVIAEGLEHPWGLALLPDGRFLVTERNPGQLRIGDRDGRLSEPIGGVPPVFRFEGETGRSQGGLFDVRLHPDFQENGWVYLSFSRPTDRGAALAVVRGRLEEGGATPQLVDVEPIFEMNEDDQDSSGLHFGGRMVFDQGRRALLLTVGERRNISRAQDPQDQAGSVLSMTYEGAPAPDNPDLEEGDAYLWSWGHRNPQGITVHPETRDVWIVDHGPEGGDELNRVQAGENHAWPYFTGGVDYSGAPIGRDQVPEGMTAPYHIFEETIAPSGLVVYTGEAFPRWDGDFLIGGLITEGLVRVRAGPQGVLEEETLLTDLGRRVRDVQVADDGAVWIITEHSDAEVIRVSNPSLVGASDAR